MKQGCKDCQKQKRRKPPYVRVEVTIGRKPLLTDWKAELSSVLERWRGTPYVADAATPGVGVCCYGFMAGVLDELHGLSSTPPIAIPHQLAINAPRQATRAALRLIQRYPHERVRDVYELEPGDVLFIRVGRGVGHAGIVGLDVRSVWHADSGVGVCFTGIGHFRTRIIRVYRSPVRHTWKRRLRSRAS